MEDWVDEQENLLKNWAEKMRFYAWMHHKTAIYYQKIHNMLSYPLIIISTICGSANFILVGKDNKDEYYTVIYPLCLGMLSMATAIVSSIMEYAKCYEVSTKHMELYKQYNIIVRNICMELSIPREQRRSSVEFSANFKHHFDRLMTDSPTIPTHIIKEFNKKFPCVRNKPEISNNFEKIVIYGRTQRIHEYERLFRLNRYFNKWIKDNNHNKQMKTETFNTRTRKPSLIEDIHNKNFQNFSLTNDDNTVILNIKEDEPRSYKYVD